MNHARSHGHAVHRNASLNSHVFCSMWRWAGGWKRDRHIEMGVCDLTSRSLQCKLIEDRTPSKIGKAPER